LIQREILAVEKLTLHFKWVFGAISQSELLGERTRIRPNLNDSFCIFTAPFAATIHHHHLGDFKFPDGFGDGINK
jgi:hypothetical protein